MNNRTTVSILLVSALFASAGATDLYWYGGGTSTGNVSVWNNTNQFWKVDDAGDLVSWGSVDEPRTAFFTSTAWFCITTPKPAAITVDAPAGNLVRFLGGASYSWSMVFSSLKQVVMRGAGKLELYDQNNIPTSGWGFSGRSDCLFDVQSGTLRFTIDTEATSEKVGLARSLYGSNGVRVGQEAVFDVYADCGIGTADGDRLDVELNGGVFRVSGKGETNYFGDVAYNGGSIELKDHENSNDKLKMTAVMGKFSVTGNVARTLSLSWDSKAYLICSPGPARTEILVDDVTGSSDADFTVPAYGHILFPDGFVKTGSGTMQLNTSFDDNRTGDFEIREGKLRLAERQDYMDCGEHVFTVNTNATLEIPLRNNISGGYNIYHGRYAQTRYLVYGGSLIIGDTDLWGTCWLGDELLLDNARFECRMKGSGTGDAQTGALVFSRKTTLRGETPYVFSPYETAEPLQAAYHFWPETMGGTVIAVDDITGDPAADATFNVRFRDYVSVSNRADAASAPSAPMTSGVTKKGAGTLYLANPKNAFTGPVRVDEGTLWTDGPAASASVAAGACLGGTGTVATVTFAEGAGLSARVGQTDPLKVTAQVALPGTGVVDVYSAEEELPGRVDIPVLESAGGLTGAVTGWTVRLNGVASTAFSVYTDGGQVRVKRDRGLVILIL